MMHFLITLSRLIFVGHFQFPLSNIRMEKMSPDKPKHSFLPRIRFPWLCTRTVKPGNGMVFTFVVIPFTYGFSPQNKSQKA